MTARQIIIMILTMSFLTCCRQGYKIENGKVYYEYWNEGSGQGKRLIDQADARTFQKLKFDCDCSFDFGKDKNHLFIDGEPIKEIDPNTFKFIDNYLFTDKENAYFFGFYNNLNDCAIRGINPNKIKSIKYPWAKADNILIYGRDTVYLDDINDFIPIDENWGKTKKYIINKNRILNGANVETFKIVNSFSGKDKNYNYEFGYIARDDFKKTEYKSFNFDKAAICDYGLIEFVGIYDNEEPLAYYQNEKSLIAEKLELKGFTLKNEKIGDWSSGPRIVSFTLSNNKCDCFVEKLYYYDYSKPSETEKTYNVTERLHCKMKEM